MMTTDPERFSLEEISSLAGVPRRTIRFYMQKGLVDRPLGAKRGAYYTRGHLEQLLAVRRWRKAGLTLERIRELVAEPEDGQLVPPERPRRPGDVAVRSHILLGPGVELVIEPEAAGLTPEEARSLARKAAELLVRPSGPRSE